MTSSSSLKRSVPDTSRVALTSPSLEPGKPIQNAYIERFNRSVREEVLDAWGFNTLAEVRATREAWRHRDNTERSHASLGNVPPLTFIRRPTSATELTFILCT